MIVDGVPGTVFVPIGPKNVIFSSDSQHWACVGWQSHGEALVLDGVVGPGFSGVEAGPMQCADGHLEYIAYEGKGASQRLMRVTVKGFGPVGP